MAPLRVDVMLGGGELAVPLGLWASVALSEITCRTGQVAGGAAPDGRYAGQRDAWHCTIHNARIHVASRTVHR